ncbi:hypothetical protein BB561_001197 [Smittium simulii]|uniref:Uncharacterized protein n=1 Tax=Smittium simulii TaxID=133385 RepID=A0A2T9YVP6_9FUNG|nr:hypothetical protein BB561_001197 [Smittium simulii]
MPSATPLRPIVGAFKRRVMRDIAIGTVAATCSSIEKTNQYYADLAKNYKKE